jgi:hypothetical protein
VGKGGRKMSGGERYEEGDRAREYNTDDFEGHGRECEKLVKVGKGEEMDSPLEPLEVTVLLILMLFQ